MRTPPQMCQGSSSSLFDNPTIRVLNAAQRSGLSVVGNNMQTINATCAILNSSPTEFIIGNQGVLPKCEYGLTHPGFAHTRILDSLKQIPIYKEVLDFKTSERENAYLESLNPLSPKAAQQAGIFRMGRAIPEMCSVTQSSSLNGSNDESSHPINNKNMRERKTVKNGNVYCQDFSGMGPVQSMNHASEEITGNYMPIVVAKGSNAIIPPGYIQIQTEKANSRKTKVVTNCEHTERKHYAKGLCSSCYHKGGRTKKSWNCDHKDRVHYAKGCCHECYITFHSKRGKKKLRKNINEDLNDIQKVLNDSGSSSVFEEAF